MKTLILISLHLLTCSLIVADTDTRYFGGVSNGDLHIAKSMKYTAPLIVTEEVFTAESSDDIDKVVEDNKLFDIENGNGAKEFIEDKTGHLYGGLSEGELSF